MMRFLVRYNLASGVSGPFNSYIYIYIYLYNDIWYIYKSSCIDKFKFSSDR